MGGVEDIHRRPCSRCPVSRVRRPDRLRRDALATLNCNDVPLVSCHEAWIAFEQLLERILGCFSARICRCRGADGAGRARSSAALRHGSQTNQRARTERVVALRVFVGWLDGWSALGWVRVSKGATAAKAGGSGGQSRRGRREPSDWDTRQTVIHTVVSRAVRGMTGPRVCRAQKFSCVTAVGSCRLCPPRSTPPRFSRLLTPRRERTGRERRAPSTCVSNG